MPHYNIKILRIAQILYFNCSPGICRKHITSSSTNHLRSLLIPRGQVPLWRPTIVHPVCDVAPMKSFSLLFFNSVDCQVFSNPPAPLWTIIKVLSYTLHTPQTLCKDQSKKHRSTHPRVLIFCYCFRKNID